MDTYTSYYDVEFPLSRAVYSPVEGVLKAPFTVTLTTRSLPDYERGQVTTRYRERLARLEQEISDLLTIAITTRMLWRCSALACLQAHQELFSLQNVGLMLIANGVHLGKEYAQLHGLLQSFMEHMAHFPGLEVYYQLPDTLDEHVGGEEVSSMQNLGMYLSLPSAVSVLSRTDFSWDGITGDLQEIAIQGGDPYGYAVLYVPEESRQYPGWYALRAEPIQRGLRDGLVVARQDNWCRGFTFLRMPSERHCPDLNAALAHIQEDVQRLRRGTVQEGGGDTSSLEPFPGEERR